MRRERECCHSTRSALGWRGGELYFHNYGCGDDGGILADGVQGVQNVTVVQKDSELQPLIVDSVIFALEKSRDVWLGM